MARLKFFLLSCGLFMLMRTATSSHRCLQGDVRLVGGTNQFEGRVEVCNNRAWGTVCDDSWSVSDGNVVCSQLGYGRATSAPGSAYFGQGSGNIVLDQLACTGTEASLFDCPHNGLNRHDCSHYEDAGVVCARCLQGDVRLVGGTNQLEGRVEVCNYEAWGTVCDDSWSVSDGNVVCSQLGFGRATSAPGSARFGQGSGNIVLDNLACTGTEASLFDCPHNGLNRHNCHHSEDAGVVCAYCLQGDVRLVGGTNQLEGRVEVCNNRAWGTVCDDSWSVSDGNVVCSQLGFGRATSAPGSAYFGQGSGSIVLDQLACTGTEASLFDCPHNGLNRHDCSHYEDAGVVCTRSTCSILSSPGNGRVSVNSYFVGGTARYFCNTEYGLRYGSSSRSCQSNGVWSGSQPSCHRTCHSLSSPGNGRVSINSYFEGGTARYYCNTGYGIRGSSSRRCQSNGVWSGSQPSCLRTCHSLSRPDNGGVSASSYLVGSTARYYCNTGYTLSGSSSRTCQSNGYWSGSQPSCYGTCSTDDAELVNERSKKQEKVLESILEQIAPELVSGIFGLDSYSTDYLTVIKAVYTSLSEKFGFNYSEPRFNSFVEAVTEISSVEEEACTVGNAHAVSSDNFPELVTEFNNAFSGTGRSRNLTAIRSVYGKMLCIVRQGTSTTRRHKRMHTDCDPLHLCSPVDNIKCPDGGIAVASCPCQFFRCLDPDMLFSTIFGWEPLSKQCLAFVIDTTGSMTDDIDDARTVILDFVRAEEHLGIFGCYMLVPFNDVGPDESVGPITSANTFKLEDLNTFYGVVQALKASGGGDLPEYALDGILIALNHKRTLITINPSTGQETRSDGPRFLISGSHIVVITDAPTKHQSIKDMVIEIANDEMVCIHFFVRNAYSIADGIYQSVASRTGGTLVNGITGWELAKFISLYRTSARCEPAESTTPGRRKRAPISPRPSLCHIFQISQLTLLMTFSAQSNSTVTLTRPSGTTLPINLHTNPRSTNYSIHSEPHPEAGNWTACVSSGILEISINQEFSLDATVLYVKNVSGTLPVASVSPPTECSAAKIMLVSSKSSLLLKPDLSLLDDERNVVQRYPLQGCGNALITNMTFPKGENYTYQIDGTDTIGTPVSYHINKKVNFASGRYRLESDSEEGIEIELDDPIHFSFSFTNLNAFPSFFNFIKVSSGFSVNLQPSHALIPPRETIHVNARALVSSSSINRGSSYNIQVEARNGCTAMTYTKTVRIREDVGTTPPPDVCGCLNGGTCVVTRHFGFVFQSCVCPSGYRGSNCQIDRTS